MRTLSKKMQGWIKDKARSAGTKGAVFGLSGGIDSAVVGVVAKRAFGKNTLALIMPCHSHKKDIRDAKAIAKRFGIRSKVVDLTKMFDAIVKTYKAGKVDPHKKDTALSNLKPRLRMMTLYYFANKNNYLVLGTGNKSELVMGYFTKYGDGGVDLLPLGGLLKRQVRRLALELGIPENIIYRVPSAGLWKGQTDEGEMGITYEMLDNIIAGLERKKTAGLDERIVEKVRTQHKKTEHKRRSPEVFNG